MEIMKKIISLFLVVAMCFSLVACGGSESTNEDNNSEIKQENTNDEEQSTNNEEQSTNDEEQGTNNEEQSTNSTENQDNNQNIKELNENEVNVVGTWNNINAIFMGAVVIFNEGGTGTMAYNGMEVAGTWTQTDEKIIFSFDNGEMKFKAQENNGIVELLRDDGDIVLVSANDYDNLVECVEITMENWQQYFEIRPCAAPFDDGKYLRVGVVLMLKDNYVKDYIAAEGYVDVSFDGEYRCPVVYNSSTKEVTLGTPYTKEECEQKGYKLNWGTKSLTDYELDSDITMIDYGREDCFELSGSIGYPRDKWKIDGDVITVDAYYFETIDITKIQGTLYLNK